MIVLGPPARCNLKKARRRDRMAIPQIPAVEEPCPGSATHFPSGIDPICKTRPPRMIPAGFDDQGGRPADGRFYPLILISGTGTTTIGRRIH